jgi:hypothetical protein
MLVRNWFALVAQVLCERIRICTVICRGDVVQHLGMIRESLNSLYPQVILNPCFPRMERELQVVHTGRAIIESTSK